MGRFTHLAAGALLLSAGLAAAPAQAQFGFLRHFGFFIPPDLNARPGFIVGEVLKTRYDGVTNDLLTGGLGRDGLANPTPPPFADPLNPTAEELRTRAIHANYRALVDTAPGGGYGTLFGPNVNAEGEVTDSRGLIAGEEVLAFARSGFRNKVVVMVQIPDGFDPADPCMVTAPSSGSRGIYGAIGTAGEWGLKRGCTVVYTDKGTGTGAHNLADNTVQLIDGRLADADEAGREAHFRAPVSDFVRRLFDQRYPDRFAFKHAHSQAHPEADWGRNVLQSIRFGFYVLNQRFGEQHRLWGRTVRTASLTPENTLVIASSVSNGGGASVRAAEMDRKGLIDGVAVSEPNVNPRPERGFSIQQGDADPISDHSRSLYDYTTALAVYQGCANLAPGNAAAPFNGVFNDATVNSNTCAALAAKGLVSGTTVEEQATDAQRVLNERFDIQPEQNPVQPAQYGLNVPQAIAITYANAYGRFSVLRNLCGFSFGATGAEGSPAALAPEAEAALFASSNGIPPTGGVNAIYNASVGGPQAITQGQSPSSGTADYSLDGFLCLRDLASGKDTVTGERLRRFERFRALRVKFGIRRVRASGDLQGTPTVFVTGRADAILPINHTSRPYFGLNQRVDRASAMRYYEVLNAQHLDVLNGLPGFNERFIPLHHYFNQAMDLVYDHLKNATPLPPSQVVRTTPRGPGAPPITVEANLPPIQADPPAGDRIVFDDDADLLRIPQ